jgi:hypothetical protein
LRRAAKPFGEEIAKEVDGADEIHLDGSVLRRVRPGIDQWKYVAREGKADPEMIRKLTEKQNLIEKIKRDFRDTKHENSEIGDTVVAHNDTLVAGDKEKNDRERIKDLIEKVVRCSKATIHTGSDAGDTVVVYDDTLVAGDFELRVNTGIGDGYVHCSVTAKYQGQEVFADRFNNNLFIRGDWETLLTQLSSQDSTS